MCLRIGDIFWLKVIYPATGESEERPVVIVAFDEETPLFATFSSITTSNIKNFDGKYDKWKSPIFHWEKAGLREPTFVKANNIATTNRVAFLPIKYIGRLYKSDLANAQALIEKFLNSDEELW